MAFRKETTTVRKKELVLFLTPKIIEGDKNFYEAPNEYTVSTEVEEVIVKDIPEFYVNPLKKTKNYLEDEIFYK